MVRVGGGWDTLQNYLDKHDPCRCRRGNNPQIQSSDSVSTFHDTRNIIQQSTQMDQCFVPFILFNCQIISPQDTAAPLRKSWNVLMLASQEGRTFINDTLLLLHREYFVINYCDQRQIILANIKAKYNLFENRWVL